MTGNLERPSQDASENRKAEHGRRYSQNRQASARASLRALGAAEMDLLLASQRAARKAMLQAIETALGAHHASAIALVVSRYASQRAALTTLGAGAAAAALHRLSTEEAAELANLALMHAAEKRALKRDAALALLPAQKTARQTLRRSARRSRLAAAVMLSPRVTLPHVRQPPGSPRVRSSFLIPRRR